jgi:hypothetical protein
MLNRKWIITWNAGYGTSVEVVVAETEEKAMEEAYERWREEAESNADYSAKPYSEELAEDFGAE